MEIPLFPSEAACMKKRDFIESSVLVETDSRSPASGLDREGASGEEDEVFHLAVR